MSVETNTSLKRFAHDSAAVYSLGQNLVNFREQFFRGVLKAFNDLTSFG